MILEETIHGEDKNRIEDDERKISMFKQYLLSAKENGNPVSIYSDNESTERFSFGFIQGVSDDYVLLASISPLGFYDGYVIIKYKDIYRLEKNDKYGEKVYKLYGIRKQNHPIVPLTSDNIILDLIQFSRDKQLVVTIELDNSGYDDLQGIVSEIQGDMVVVMQIDDDGNPDGKTVVCFDRITRAICDSDKEMAIKLLSENQ